MLFSISGRCLRDRSSDGAWRDRAGRAARGGVGAAFRGAGAFLTGLAALRAAVRAFAVARLAVRLTAPARFPRVFTRVLAARAPARFRLLVRFRAAEPCRAARFFAI